MTQCKVTKLNVIKLNHNNNNNKIMKTILLIFILTLSSGCFSQYDRKLNQDTNIQPQPAEVPAQPEPTPTPIALPVGWTELSWIANSAKTRISTGGHFTTSRNACGKEAYGGVELEAWNKMTTALNLAVQKEPLREDYCVSIPETPPYMDGAVDVKIAGGTLRTIYQLKGDQICSTVQDSKISDDLLSAITRIIAAADKEDCPNGWGSN